MRIADADAEASTSPPRSPELNGSVERNNGAWRYGFYATRDLPDDSRYGDGRAFPGAPASRRRAREARNNVDAGVSPALPEAATTDPGQNEKCREAIRRLRAASWRVMSAA